MFRRIAWIVVALNSAWALRANAQEGRPFAIRVVDDETGRGVPLVELKTVSQARYVTDSAGYVAFREPGWMNQRVFFYVKSHGYEFPKDGFGFAGKRLTTTEGGEETLRIRRVNIAERLYRMTGAGIYRDSVLLGKQVPVCEPLLNAQVVGSDSVVTEMFDGKLHWFWGDTNRPSYPLGNFHVPGATSRPPSDGGLDPDVGVDLTYVTQPDGFASPLAKMPGDGPTWIGGLAVLKDAQGRERMFAGYAKIRKMLETYERGICEFDRESRAFKKLRAFPPTIPLYPDGHPFEATLNGRKYLYFAAGYPLTRVSADVDSYLDPSTYESFTPLRQGSTLEKLDLDLDDRGRARYAWKRGTPPLRPQEQMKLVRTGKLGKEDAILALRDVETGREFLGHGGSVYWNEHRKRWSMVILESFGNPSLLGEVWYAEAPNPLGPWVYARKIVSHERYSFYNPKQHPQLAKQNGRFLFFEGTYSHTFSGNSDQTPWYDYNQIMYKLDIDDPRLNLPVPFKGLVPTKERAEFFAMTRPGPVLKRVFTAGKGAERRLLFGNGESDGPVFFVLPADSKPATPDAIPLLEFASTDGRRFEYSVDPKFRAPGFRAQGRPVGLVWKNPIDVELTD